MAKIDYSFGYKNTWFAIKGVGIHTILLGCSNLVNAKVTTWKNGLLEVENSQSKVLLSGPYGDWSFLIGKGLYNPSQVDQVIAFLLKMGEFAEEVCYFSSYRTVGLYGFAKMVQGKIIRLYCYTDEEGHIYNNIGERTDAEKELALNFAINDNQLFEEGFDEIDEDNILRIAEKISLSPVCLIGMEESESIITDTTFK